MDNMNAIDISPEVFHLEYAPGQCELTYSPAFGIKCPDNGFRFKHLTKDLALKRGYIASFMSKPYLDESGSSGHFNHCLWDKDNINVFYDNNRSLGISKLAEHWVAGLRYHSNALMCLACPTPNCYERTIPGCFAPVNNAWGMENRSVAFRVKAIDASRSYVENRMPGGSVNPYLITAATIIAGLDGIERKLELGNEMKGDASFITDLPDDVKPLPKSLDEALEYFISSELFSKEFGPEFMQCFSVIKKFECTKATEQKQQGLVKKWYLDYYAKYL